MYKSYLPPSVQTNVNTVSIGAQAGSPQTTSLTSISNPLRYNNQQIKRK